jgi:hypothetical protein
LRLQGFGLVWLLFAVPIGAFRSGAASCFPPPGGLVSWWRGEGNANDFTGTNNGTLQGGATATATGMVGSAFSFDGTNSFVQIADSSSLKPTNLTIEAWVNFSGLDSALSGTAPAGDQYMVFKQSSQMFNFEGYSLEKFRLAGGDVFQFTVASSSGVEVFLPSVTTVSTGVWYHVAAVRGSNFTQIYVNGQFENQTNVSFPQDYGTLPLFFGTSGQGFWDGKLKGRLDEVSIYNRALTSNEIAGIYLAGSAGKCTNNTNPPFISGQPQSQTVLVGSNVSFMVTASSSTALSYQWQRSSTNLSNGGNVAGATTSALNLTGVQTKDAADYRVIVTNLYGAATSAVATLTVSVPTAAQLANLPATGILANQATLNGQVIATGGDPPTVTLFYGTANGITNAGAWAQNVNLGVQTGPFAQTVPGLSSNTLYYFTSRAVNAGGTGWATPSQSFTTLASNPPPPAFAGVLSHHNDNARSGANLNETALNIGNVNTNQFGLLYNRPVDDQIYAQPLIAPNVNIPTKGTHNLVIVATVNDSVYAFDADDPTVSAPYWQVSFLGPNVVAPSSNDILASPCGTFFNIAGNFGIIGTPVIDPVAGTIYLVARTKEFGTNFVQRLHALDLTTGSERPNSPVVIAATYPGTNSLDSANGLITFDPFKHNQRAGLALVNGIVYIAWSSHCDWEPYHGWLIGYDATTLQQAVVFMTTPNGREGAIWMSGQAPAADTNGNLYISVGNGPATNAISPQMPGHRVESFLKLTLSGTNLNVASSFTPYNWQSLDASDQDLGAAGLLLIPGTTLAVSGGKGGVAYVVNRDNMGGLSQTSADTNIVQSFRVTTDTLQSGPVWWDGPDGSYAYFWPSSDYLQQYKFDRTNGVFLMPRYAQSPAPAPGGHPGGFLAVSATGTNAGSGIVWASRPFSGNAQGSTVPGILMAHNAQNVAMELWDSEKVSARDSVGNFAKFVPPTVANGKVYLATFSNRLKVYGLFPRPILAISLGGANALLTWPTNTMFTYTLQGNTNLLSSNWFNVTNQVAVTNTSFQVKVPLAGAQTFYRLKR